MANSTPKANTIKTITRCPQCKTAFRVTAEQLNAAKGMVRCGSCLTIFKAYDYIAPPAPTKNTKDTETYNDDSVISGGLNLNDNSFTESSPQTSHSLFERQPKKEKKHADAADESWAVDLLAELEDDDDIRPIIVKRKKNQELATSKIAQKQTEVAQAVTAKQTNSIINQEEQTAANDSSDQPTSANPPHDNDQHSKNDTHKLTAINQQNSTFGLAANNEPIIGTGSLEIFDDIEVDTDWQHDKPSSIRWPWALASLVGIILIVGQVAVFKFDTLSRQEPYRSAYSAVCNVLNCTLPHLVDVKKIKDDRFVISPHPTNDKAITADIIISNTATFDQPYPEVVLTFTNQKNEIIGKRSFTPSEYLAGDLKGHTIMPKQQKVQFDLELIKPSQDDFGYTLSIH